MNDNKDNTFFSDKLNYAIVGASNNEDKFGYKILKALKDKNFNVIPINPKEEFICGLKVYKNLNEVNKKIDVVNFVVPPNVTLNILEDVKKLKIKMVWFQPNSYDNRCINFCKNNRIQYINNECLYEKVKNLK